MRGIKPSGITRQELPYLESLSYLVEICPGGDSIYKKGKDARREF